MIQIPVQTPVAKRELLEAMKADFAGKYQVYVWGFRWGKALMVRKSRFVGVMVLSNPKRNRIDVFGFFPSIWTYYFLSGIVPLLIGRRLFKQQWDTLEEEVAQHIAKKYNAVAEKEIIKTSMKILQVIIVVFFCIVLLLLAASIETP